MNGGQMPASMSMSLPVYWRKNQVILTLFSDLEPDDPEDKVLQTVTTSLNDINTNAQALYDTPFNLARLTASSGAFSSQATGDDMSGIYVYSKPTAFEGSRNPLLSIAVACTIETSTPSMDKNSANDDMNDTMEDITLRVVKLLNTYGQSDQPPTRSQSMPNWFWTGVPDETHGCPITPPFPVGNSGSTGMWKTILPQLPANLQRATGAGVTVIILDAFPSPAQIASAAQSAGNQNMLLQQMATGMVSEGSFQAKPPAIGLNYTYSIPGPMETAVTGKDIYGRLSGFPMPDHGLFVAGLVRDLAPGASIECVRVLNDFGVGQSTVLFQALTEIEGRQRYGDLQGKPIVINLSLVLGPPECDLARLNLTAQADPQNDPDTQALLTLLDGLLELMQSMADRGATFVASVGNDSDPRDFTMNLSEMRFNPRYPAAFAMTNPELPHRKVVIPVGATNQQGRPAAYSNYPGPYGIATYAGELPKPSPWFPSAVSHELAQVDTTGPIDALCGLYTGSAYPALSRNDQYPASMQPQPDPSSPTPMGTPVYPLYKATLTSAWAYWAGTSFAAPIISALAARVLQGQAVDFRSDTVYSTLAAAGQQVIWTGIEQGGEVSGPLIPAIQEWLNEVPHYS